MGKGSARNSYVVYRTQAGCTRASTTPEQNLHNIGNSDLIIGGARNKPSLLTGGSSHPALASSQWPLQGLVNQSLAGRSEPPQAGACQPNHVQRVQGAQEQGLPDTPPYCNDSASLDTPVEHGSLHHHSCVKLSCGTVIPGEAELLREEEACIGTASANWNQSFSVTSLHCSTGGGQASLAVENKNATNTITTLDTNSAQTWHAVQPTGSALAEPSHLPTG